MPIRTFVPTSYDSNNNGVAIPDNELFNDDHIPLLSDFADLETGIKLRANATNIFGFQNWGTVDPYFGGQSIRFQFEIDVIGEKTPGDLTANIHIPGTMVSEITLSQPTSVAGTYTFNPITNPDVEPQLYFLTPSTSQIFDGVTLNLQHTTNNLVISSIRLIVETNQGGKVTLSAGYVLGRQGKISI